nr:gamma-glutamylcyclotransferase family protein [Synechococcus sp. CCY 9618]
MVFVYGTLKRGFCNHHWLAGCSFEGEAAIEGLVLHDLGPFPMAIPGGGAVWGEVFRLMGEALARLDRLEGYPRLYDRLPMALADGRWAWVYVGRPRQVRFVPALLDGRWPALRPPASGPPWPGRSPGPSGPGSGRSRG